MRHWFNHEELSVVGFGTAVLIRMEIRNNRLILLGVASTRDIGPAILSCPLTDCMCGRLEARVRGLISRFDSGQCLLDKIFCKRKVTEEIYERYTNEEKGMAILHVCYNTTEHLLEAKEKTDGYKPIRTYRD